MRHENCNKNHHILSITAKNGTIRKRAVADIFLGSSVKKRIRNYLLHVEAISLDYANGSRHATQKEEDIRDLLIQIQFFQHERLNHLLVTLAVVFLFTGVTLYIAAFPATIPIILVHLLLFVLTVPYIAHYFTLENGVQKLYRVYDHWSGNFKAMDNAKF
jgi:hypothetical protein